MKRIVTYSIALLLLLSLTACGATPTQADTIAPPLTLDKVGIEPFSFTPREEQLMQAFGLTDGARLFLYQAPKEATTMRIQSYTLQKDGTWGEACSVAERYTDPADPSPFHGYLSLQYDAETDDLALRTNEAVYPHIPAPKIPFETLAHARDSLKQFEPIALGSEIPLVLTIYSENSVYTDSNLQAFSTPKTLLHDEYVAVTALTLTFSDELPTK